VGKNNFKNEKPWATKPKNVTAQKHVQDKKKVKIK
jgi:hypothetical protein